MGEIVILKDYKKKKEEEELEDLKQRVNEALTAIDVYPGNIYLSSYEPLDSGYYTCDLADYENASLTYPLAGSVDPGYSYYEYCFDGDGDES